MTTTYDPHRKVDAVIPFRREYTPFQLPLTGSGYLAGTFPNGLTTIEGSPTPATVRILLRTGKGHPGDGSLVKEVQSNQDGTWIVEGLNPDLKYDVVGRLKDFNDVIMSNISPVVADEIRWVGNLEWDGVKVAGMLRFTGGVGPYSVTSVSGLPAGLTPELLGNELTIVGVPTEGGEFTGVIGVKDSGSLTADVVVRLEVFDPYWDKVVSLLHFDGDLTDKTGREWTTLGTVQAMANEHAFGGIGAYFSGSGSGLEGMPLIPATGDWTLELRFMSDPNYTDRHIVGQNTRSGAGAINRFVVEQSGENQITIGHHNGSQWRFLYVNYTPSTEGFNSLMVSREGNRICGSVNGGEIVRTAELGGLAFAQVPFTIGVYSVDVNRSFIGFIDEFRFTKGIARYTEDFIPPTAPFPNFGPPA